MSVNTPIPRYRLALCAAAAAGMALVVPSLPAHAQPYGAPYDAYDAGPSNDITVYASPRAGRDPYTGAPYERVETSRVVSYADLDLNSRWGVRELRARVISAARDACDELENDPMTITASDDPPCVSTAVHRAMYQAPIPDYFQDDAEY
ncbi:MAG TPA: UrcA family protein [Caulobacteraceae bacterium]|jgi:UrcA family protein|nr:UrcA family protein [Caulobacteraceae bacterium]